MIDSAPVLERIKKLLQAILAEVHKMLVGNLPPWPIVEAGVTAAYNQYVRPLGIPDFLDDILLKALLSKAEEIYGEFA
jgi:hypothetical protein